MRRRRTCGAVTLQKVEGRVIRHCKDHSRTFFYMQVLTRRCGGAEKISVFLRVSA